MELMIFSKDIEDAKYGSISMMSGHQKGKNW